MSSVLTVNEVEKLTLAQVKQRALAAKVSLWKAANGVGRDVKVYLHWTAGRYGQFWDEYHLQIDQDGCCYMPRQITLETQISGTYMRNSGSVAVALLGCFDATTGDGLGSNPPTNAQIETMARVIAVLSQALSLATDIKHVMTHGEAADNEDGLNPGYEANGYPDGMYGPKHSVERWDLEYLGTKESLCYNPAAKSGSRGGDVLRGKARWYVSTYPDGVEKHFS